MQRRNLSWNESLVALNSLHFKVMLLIYPIKFDIKHIRQWWHHWEPKTVYTVRNIQVSVIAYYLKNSAMCNILKLDF